MDPSRTTKGAGERGRSMTGLTANKEDTSDDRLLELGYAPEFRREMSFFGVLGMSFCAIGILTGMSSAFQTGLFSGGPLGGFYTCFMTSPAIPFDVVGRSFLGLEREYLMLSQHFLLIS
jgi:hypothetical protein